HLPVAPEGNRPDVALSQAVAANQLLRRLTELVQRMLEGEVVELGGLREPIEVVLMAKDRRPALGVVAADPLEDPCAVVEPVREHVHIRLVPPDELAVLPDQLRLLHESRKYERCPGLQGLENRHPQGSSGALRRSAAYLCRFRASAPAPSGAVDRSAGLLTGERLANTTCRVPQSSARPSPWTGQPDYCFSSKAAVAYSHRPAEDALTAAPKQRSRSSSLLAYGSVAVGRRGYGKGTSRSPCRR